MVCHVLARRSCAWRDAPAAFAQRLHPRTPCQEDEGFAGSFLEYLQALDGEPLSPPERAVLREAFAAAAAAANEGEDAGGAAPVDPEAEIFPEE